MKPTLIMNYIALSAIAAHRFIAPGAEDNSVIQASGGTAALIGVSTDVNASTGGRADVVHSGLTPVEFGGSISFGDPLTADEDGKAVVAQEGDRIAGTAMCSGINNDIGLVLLGTGATQPSAPTGGE